MFQLNGQDHLTKISPHEVGEKLGRRVDTTGYTGSHCSFWQHWKEGQSAFNDGRAVSVVRRQDS